MTGGARAAAASGAALLRHVVGFAIAPAVPAVAGLGYELFRMTLADTPGGPRLAALTTSRLHLLASFALDWIPGAYAVALALGIPIVLALRASGRLTVPWVVGVASAAVPAAIAAGVLLASVVKEDPTRPEDLPLVAVVAGLGAALAAAASGTYCAIAGVPLGSGPARPSPAGRE